MNAALQELAVETQGGEFDNYLPRFNICPTTQIPVIRRDVDAAMLARDPLRLLGREEPVPRTVDHEERLNNPGEHPVKGEGLRALERLGLDRVFVVSSGSTDRSDEIVRAVAAGGAAVSAFKSRCIRSKRPFCCGAPGSMGSGSTPHWISQTAGRDSPAEAFDQELIPAGRGRPW